MSVAFCCSHFGVNWVLLTALRWLLEHSWSRLSHQ